MIEQFIKCLIEELGTNGIMLLGLFAIMIHVAREISAPLKKINSEVGEIRDTLKDLVRLMSK